MARSKQSPKRLRTDAVKLVADCAGLGSRVVARRITQFLERELATTDLTLAQLGLLAQIAASSDDTIGALAVRVGLDQSTLSRNVQALAAEGLVEVTMVQDDLRRRCVWLTEAGAMRLERAIPIWRKALAKLEDRISTDLVHQLVRQTSELYDEMN